MVNPTWLGKYGLPGGAGGPGSQVLTTWGPTPRASAGVLEVNSP